MDDIIEVSLPPCDKTNWDAVCYCMVSENTDRPRLYGVGKTIEECMIDAQKTKLNSRNGSQTMKMAELFVRCGLDTGVRITPMRANTIIIRHCDMKLYMYAKRVGKDQIIFYNDPFIKKIVVRFVGLRCDTHRGKYEAQKARKNAKARCVNE